MLRGIALMAIRGDRGLFSGLGLELGAGELLYVNGPNGSGKTTLLRMLCGLTLPVEGRVQWKDQDIRTLGDDYRRELLYCGHHNAVKDDLTGRENLRVAVQLGGGRKSTAECHEALDRMGLGDVSDLPAKLLSQGQRRRLSLARLMVSTAPLWILDEPFSALDAGAVERLQTTIGRHLEAGGLVVLTTHQPVSIPAAATRQLSMGARV